jgi:hypothetical protein
VKLKEELEELRYLKITTESEREDLMKENERIVSSNSLALKQL